MKVDRDIYNRLVEITKLKPWNQPTKLEEFVKELKPRSERSEKQSNSIHLWCQQMADELNEKGLDMRAVLKEDWRIWWSKDTFKENVWKPVQKALTGKESTTELEKTSTEIDDIVAMIHKNVLEKHPDVEYIPFPHDPEQLGSNVQTHDKVK